ncbi:MAG: ABC transporter permease subunit [Chloroflexi bacterium]|nr:ABC transporter permease subunit [Chloroflexota bacterium]
MKNNKALQHSIRLGLTVLVAMIIYAYGFQVTQVSLKELNEPRRQESFSRILRALAHPEIFEYEQEEFIVETPIYMPCPEGGLSLPKPDMEAPYMLVTPACAQAEETVSVAGFNFQPNTSGPLHFIPPSGVKLQIGNITTDNDGHFEISVQLPKRKPVAEAQHLRAVTRRSTGAPRFTETAHDTWDKIIETVFLALLATTFGVAFSIPISFMAARNLMKDITIPMASLALTILGWPIGVYLGMQAARVSAQTSAALSQNTPLGLGALIAVPLIGLGLARWALPQEETQQPALQMRLARMAGLLIAALSALLFIFVLAHYTQQAGLAIVAASPSIGFMGSFFASVAEIIAAIMPLVAALAVGASLGGLGGKIGGYLNERAPRNLMMALNVLLAMSAGAVTMIALGAAVEWLYEIGQPLFTFWLPAAAGAVIGLVVVYFNRTKDALPIGMTVYYVTRTILNALRSIEAFIMAIVFVALLSTGPFAGVMALSLHTVAALAKLYSEQVESILPGPLEAIKATGATRLQTIIYAVIPQIVPPYISFTMYRWDINVRMSTIIGFVGGGGIGFLLQQNINLLNYRAASVQMLAITVVVAFMDYLSSSLREKMV